MTDRDDLTSNLFLEWEPRFYQPRCEKICGRIALRNRVRYHTKEMEKYKTIRIASILVTVSSVLWRTFVETIRVESIRKCHRSIPTSRESFDYWFIDHLRRRDEREEIIVPCPRHSLSTIIKIIVEEGEHARDCLHCYVHIVKVLSNLIKYYCAQISDPFLDPARFPFRVEQIRSSSVCRRREPSKS